MLSREDWLRELKDRISNIYFEPLGYEVPKNIRVSCGWPSKGGLSRSRRRIGECWDAAASKDGSFEIFISPYVSEPVEVAANLMHEIIHAIVGIDEKHGPGFQKVCKRVGLNGPASETVPSDVLRHGLGKITEGLGPYNHASIDAAAVERKPAATRMIKLQCGECGYVLRTTLKWINIGLPTCYCGKKFDVVGEKLSDKTNTQV